ncbi:hypothetical protein IDJ77_03720 [Mucilaginibacter sp. ZT4R22]|uniref:Endosialidase-like protein n=1 Tax=Mucilaginibacter pankratovii TaxID=2772110 RepID=A0ABR7WKP6_9SPHI|nr:hypothetical protein [Mucilaginibacter pankratovii]MBD1362908.1 hypothetical protein [Mucilaginibacter pankratovii]
MKRLVFTFAMIAFASAAANAQNTYPWPSTAANIGIGIGNTTTPSQPLTVAGSGATSVAFLRSIAGGNASLGMALGQNFFGSFNSTTLSELQTARIRAIATQNWSTGSRGTALGFSVVANGTTTLNEALYIDQNGRVGIGTNMPVSALTLGGTGNANPNTGAEVEYVGENLSFQNQATGGGAYTLGSIKIVQPTGYYGDRGDMIFSLGSGGGGIAERMRINASGNVGIGITNAQNKLDVNGTIHSQKVVIDLIGWNDYVFDKGYKLPSLSEVKAFIDKNHHLPEIPSEKEMVKNGLDVSEMNKLLMKKVEELTLYLIQKDKQDKINDQKNQFKIKQLQHAVMRLSKPKNKRGLEAN